MDNRKIKYTSEAKKEIELFKNDQQIILEQIIIDNKYVLGDDFVEITSNDITEYSKFILNQYKPQKKVRKYKLTRMISMVYIILGLVAIMSAFYYQTIKELLEKSKEQTLLLIIGFTLLLTGLGFQIYLRWKEKN